MRVFLCVLLLAFSCPLAGVAQNYEMSVVEEHFSSMIPFLRKGAQENLRDAGFYTASIDGAWGPSTEAAFDALGQEATFSEHMQNLDLSLASEELANFPFSGKFAGAYLGLPFYEAGDDCSTCDFGENDIPQD